MTVHAFVRNAEAEKEIDLFPELTTNGRLQVEQLQRRFTLLGPAHGSPNLVITSPAECAIRTACPSWVIGDEHVKVLPILYPFGTSQWRNMDHLFEAASLDAKATLRSYLKLDRFGILTRWAHLSRQAILFACHQARVPEDGAVVRVVCHNILTSMLAIDFLGSRGPKERERILDLQLGHAHCILLRDDGAIEIIEP